MRTPYLKSDDIVGYAFKAAQYCVPHAAARVVGHAPTDEWDASTPERLMDRMAHVKGIDRSDERTFDSDEFPKVILRVHELHEDDRCMDCGEVLT